MKNNNGEPVYILAIESSCDDTGAAVFINDTCLSNITAGQKVHEKYGGVVPELASRAHQQSIVPVVQEALLAAQVDIEKINAVAVTMGPGLLGSLLVGASFSKSLALARNIPFLSVNHMEGHILAHFIQEKNEKKPTPKFPFLCLTVSGGHSQIVKVNSPRDFEIIGNTIDDAAGEAFDKAAKMLGLPYPGGPLVDKNAQQGNANAYPFPESKVDGYDFSFSGIKTSLLYFLQKQTKANPDFVRENMADICASYQETIISSLMKKLTMAAKDFEINEIALAGGVSANSRLRNVLTEAGVKNNWNTYIPAFQYCTDNAAMIAITGYFMHQNAEFSNLDAAPNSRMKI